MPSKNADHLPISAVIITHNEETHLGRALGSIQGLVNEVIVVDSGSTDNTQGVAEHFKARFIVNAWTNWTTQRNLGISLAKNDWVLVLDADEVLSGELQTSLTQAFTPPPDVYTCFSMDRRGDFLGHLLPNSQSKSRVRTFVRVFHRKYAGYDESAVHERVVGASEPLLLEGALYHWRGATLSEYLEMNNRYSTHEARAAFATRSFSLARMTLLPVLRFTWLFIFKREFRLGVPGLIHAAHRASGDFWREAKIWELSSKVPASKVLPERYGAERQIQ